MTTLIPDLLAAAQAARRSAAWHEQMAASHLLPDPSQLTRQLWPPDVQLATARAEMARADRLEWRQLLAEQLAARAADPRPQPDPPASEDAWVHPRAER